MRRISFFFVLVGLVSSQVAAQEPLALPITSAVDSQDDGQESMLDSSLEGASDEMITMSKDDLKSFIDDYLDEKKKAEEAALTPEQKKAKAMQMEANGTMVLN